MALSMQYLTGLGMEEAQAEELMGIYRETLSELEAEKGLHHDTADALARTQAERDALMERVTALQEAEEKAQAVQAAYDAYRERVEQERLHADKQAALRRALRMAGVQREEFVELLTEHVDLTQVTLENHQLRDAQQLIASLQERYSGCFAKQQVQGVPLSRPPQGSGDMTREEIMAIRDADKRQRAIAAHHELFGY